MSTYAELVHDKRNKAITDMRAILDRAAEETRDLTPEEVEQVERADADAEKYGKEADRAVRVDELAKQAAEFRGDTFRVEGPKSKEEPPAEVDLFRKGFEAVRQGGSFVLDYEQMRALRPQDTFFRALQSAGGTAVPTTFVESVLFYSRDATPMLDPSIVTILETSDGRTIDLPRVTADPNHAGTVTAEAGGINELDPTISKLSLGAFKYGITNLWSYELDQDNVINLQEILARSTARELAIDVGTHLTTGTGTVQPNGIVDDSAAGSTATGGTAVGTSYDTFFAPADLIDLFYSVTAEIRKRPTSAWMASTTAVQKMRKARDSNGGFLWDMSLIAGQPDLFNGRAVYENTAMAAVASATKSVIFGDLKSYYVRRTPLRVEFSRDYKFNTDQLALRTIIRVDGGLPLTGDIKHMVSANT